MLGILLDGVFGDPTDVSLTEDTVWGIVRRSSDKWKGDIFCISWKTIKR